MSNLPVDLNIKLEADVTKPVNDITATIVSAANFVGRVLGAPIEAMGGIVSDQIQFWRAQNIERLRDKWLAMRIERGVSPEAIKSLPFNIGVRLIEAASQEDNDEVQALWAELLDKATDPNNSVNVRRVHIDILRSISVAEVAILRFLWLRKNIYDRDPESLPNPAISDFVNKVLKKYSAEERALAVQNLRRQQCVRLAPDKYSLSIVSKIDDVLAHGKNVEKLQLISVFNALRNLVENLSGMHDNDFLGLSEAVKDSHSFIPEVFFELTELGIDLMSLCAASQVKQNA